MSKARSVSLASPAATPATVAFATDALPGTAVMDIEEAEARFDSLRDECLSFAPRLFVEDGALGGSRDAEVRVRLVTDSPAVALYARSALLQRIPLYDPEVFPRTVTVYVATLASPDIDAGRTAAGAPAPPYTVVDVDAAAGRAAVAAAGPVSFAALRSAVALAAGQLMTAGGYRATPGGDAQNPNLAEARADGILSWYARDEHWYAPAGAPHPDLLAVAADVVTAPAAGGPTLVFGAPAGGVAAAAAAKGRLYAAHHAVWVGTGAGSSVSSFWGGSTLPAGSAAAVAAAGAVRGAVTAQGGVSAPLAGPKAVAAPAGVVVIDAGAAAAGAVTGADAVARIRAVAPLTDKQAAQLTARLAGGVPVTVVKSEADALKALQLA